MDAAADATVLEAIRAYFETEHPRGRGSLAGLGAMARLQARLAEHYGMSHALCTSSATSGLLAIALANGLRHAEVIVPPLLWGGSVAALMMLGNDPVFSDVDPVTLTLDPAVVEHAITPRTAAIMSVDLFGVPADDAALRAIADAHGLLYISDGAQSFGATRAGKPAGAQASAVVLSFGPGKPMCLGEGGAVLTNDDALYDRLLVACQHPDRLTWELGRGATDEFAPIQGRMNPLAAVWGEAEWEHALRRIALWQEWCGVALEGAARTGLIQPVDLGTRGIRPAFFRLTAQWSGTPAPAELEAALRSAGLDVSVLPAPTRAVYLDPAWPGAPSGRLAARCPVAEAACDQLLWIERAPAAPGS